VAERQCDSGGRRWWFKLSTRAEESVRELGRGETGEVKAGAGGALLYGLGEGREGGNRQRLMAFKPLMAKGV
jgi:hypothetical protein